MKKLNRCMCLSFLHDKFSKGFDESFAHKPNLRGRFEKTGLDIVSCRPHYGWSRGENVGFYTQNH